MQCGSRLRFSFSSYSHTVSLHLTFFSLTQVLFSFPSSFPHFNFSDKTPSLGSGKIDRTKHVGFEDHLKLGDRAFVVKPAGHIKRWGVGEVEKGGVVQGQRGVSRKCRVLGF